MSQWTPRPMTGVVMLREETPIADRLEAAIGLETLATWNRFRGSGGEWDTLRAVPFKVRQSLTSAGYLSERGMFPDVFSDLLVQNVGDAALGSDPILWYVKTAVRAIRERKAARKRARMATLLASSGSETAFEHRNKQVVAKGHRSYFALRNEQARAGGYSSYYAYRMQNGIGDGHGRFNH